MDLRDVLDSTLELTVVGSFSRLGYAVRRRVYGWTDPHPGALEGRTVLITGPTSGLGHATASELAALGARVVLVGRSEARVGAVRDLLVARHREDRFPVVVADMGSIRSVREAVGRILDTEPRLDVLVDNAGSIFPRRVEGPDGIEATLATLVIGPFVLVGGLLPLLRRTVDSRVIAVTSGGQYAQRLILDDLQSSVASFSGTKAYARAKRAQVALVREWGRRLRPSGVRVNAMHPGWTDTPGLAESLPTFHRVMTPLLRTTGEGIDTITWLATAHNAGAHGGQLFLDRRTRPFDRVPATRLTAADRRRLWDQVVALSGLPDPASAD